MSEPIIYYDRLDSVRRQQFPLSVVLNPQLYVPKTRLGYQRSKVPDVLENLLGLIFDLQLVAHNQVYLYVDEFLLGPVHE